MSDDRYDYIAVGPRGVYAICSDIPGDPETRRFVADTVKQGHHVERVPVKEACERHRAYLRQVFPNEFGGLHD